MPGTREYQILEEVRLDVLVERRLAETDRAGEISTDALEALAGWFALVDVGKVEARHSESAHKKGGALVEVPDGADTTVKLVSAPVSTWNEQDDVNVRSSRDVRIG